METLRNSRKLVAVSRKTPENTRNGQSQNTLDPGLAQEYISEVSGDIEGRVTKKLSKEFTRSESRFWVFCLNLKNNPEPTILELVP